MQFQSFVRWAFVLVVFVVAHTGSSMADIRNWSPPGWMARAKKFYESFEPQAKQFCSNKIDEEISLLKSLGARVDDHAFKIIFKSSLVTTYQDLIDRMACLEQQFDGVADETIATSAFDERLQKSSQCHAKLSKISAEMFEWIGTYGRKFAAAMDACLVNTRRLSLEARYPPYSFMGSSEDNGLLALDSVEFLKCVKSRI